LQRTIKEHLASDASGRCLLWPFSISSNGYGQVKTPDVRRPLNVHRVAYFVHNGVWPEPWALHSCDVKLCYNPLHLRSGTPSDNVDDKLVRGRLFPGCMPRGEDNHFAKLTTDTVLALRRDAERMSWLELGIKYGIAKGHARDIVKRRCWKHI
jgi:hypothetical protein